MKLFARIDSAIVVELLSTDAPIAKLYHRDLQWVEVPTGANAEIGWRYDGATFSAPPAPIPTAAPPNLAAMDDALITLQADIAKSSKS